jgi:type VI secretion system protein ImpL
MGNNNIDNAIDLGTVFGNPPVLVSKGVATFVPAMFTAKEFNLIMSDEINVAASEALQGNWVLGASAAADQAAVDALAAQLRTQYLANYVDIWESLLANIQLSAPKNLMELDNMIAILTGNNSPLLQLLDTIKVNTSLAPVTAASPKLQSLSLLLVGDNNAQPNALYGIFVSLQELHTYLQAMLSTSDITVSISQATLQHMKNPSDDPITHIHTIAEQSPEPMKTWLNTIATKSWDFMLQETS